MRIGVLCQILFCTMSRLRKGPKPRNYPQLFDPETFEIYYVSEEFIPKLTLREQVDRYFDSDCPPEQVPVFNPDDEGQKKEVRMAIQARVGDNGMPPELMPKMVQLNSQLVDPNAAQYGQ